MSSADADFDGAFAAAGGRADLTDYPFGELLSKLREQYRGFLRHCQEQLRTLDCERDIHFDFAASPSINAGACKTDSRHMIAINVGTFDRLARLFSTLVSWPDILPELGDNSGERTASFDVAKCLQLGWQPIGDRAAASAATWLVPNDRIRYFAGMCMNTLSMDFIFTHELQHILNGHVDYFGSLGAPLRLDEAGMDIADVPPKRFQAIELEADLDASLMLASGLIERRSIYSDFSRMFDDRTFLLLWLFAVTVLFHVIDLTGSRVEHYVNANHPHPECRLEFVLSAAQAQARLTRPEIEPLIASCRQTALESMDTALRQLGLAGAVTPNRRGNRRSFVRTMVQLSKSLEATLRPVHRFRKALNLGHTFGLSPGVIRSAASDAPKNTARRKRSGAARGRKRKTP